MSFEPETGTAEWIAEYDPQRQAVYDATNEAATDYSVDYLTTEAVPQFALDALTKAKVHYDGDSPPVFRFDIHDDSEAAGAHEGATGDIHLHPKILDPWTITHELAHWKVGPAIHHGPFFCAVWERLVRAALSDEAADILLAYFDEYGVEVTDLNMKPTKLSDLE